MVQEIGKVFDFFVTDGQTMKTGHCRMGELGN